MQFQITGLSPGSARGWLCDWDNFLSLLSFKAFISQTGAPLTISQVEQCLAGPWQAHRRLASFPPTEHRGTWKIATHLSPQQSHHLLCCQKTLPAVSVAPQPRLPSFLPLQAHQGLQQLTALLAFSHCLTGWWTGRLGGQASLLGPIRLAFSCFYPPHARLCAPLPLLWITQENCHPPPWSTY